MHLEDKADPACPELASSLAQFHS